MTDDVWKVRCVIGRYGKYGHYVGDLVFVDGSPKLVIDWVGASGSEQPHTMIDLDPAHLHQMAGAGFDYLYEMPLEDSRRLT